MVDEGLCSMAAAAVESELAVVGVVMAGGTIAIQSGELERGVTLGTLGSRVRPVEGKSKFCVSEFLAVAGGLPVFRAVAELAFDLEFAVGLRLPGVSLPTACVLGFVESSATETAPQRQVTCRRRAAIP
jgi:hypothetical protein